MEDHFKNLAETIGRRYGMGGGTYANFILEVFGANGSAWASSPRNWAETTNERDMILAEMSRRSELLFAITYKSPHWQSVVLKGTGEWVLDLMIRPATFIESPSFGENAE